MKIRSTVYELLDNDDGQTTFYPVKGDNTFDTREEAERRIHELIRKNKDNRCSYTIIDEFIKS